MAFGPDFDQLWCDIDQTRPDTAREISTRLGTILAEFGPARKAGVVLMTGVGVSKCIARISVAVAQDSSTFFVSRGTERAPVHSRRLPRPVRSRTSAGSKRSGALSRLRWRRRRPRRASASLRAEALGCHAGEPVNARSMPNQSSPSDQVPQGVLVFDVSDKSLSEERIRSGAHRERATVDNPSGRNDNLSDMLSEQRSVPKVDG